MRVSIRKVKRKRGVSVILDYHDAFGKRKRRVVGSAGSEEELAALRVRAEARAATVRAELLNGVHEAERRAVYLDAALAEFLNHLERSTARPNTVRGYRETIRKFHRFLDEVYGRSVRVSELTPELLIGFVKWMTGYSDNTVNNEVVRLSRICKRLVEKGLLGSNPARHPDVRDVTPRRTSHDRAFTDEELGVFLRGCAERNMSKHRADCEDLFLLLARTGLRIGEALALRWCGVTFRAVGSFVSVERYRGWRPKTEASERFVPLARDVEGMLRKRLAGLSKLNPRELVFPVMFTNRSASLAFNRVLHRVGLDGRDHKGQKLVVHSLRHYFATQLVIAGKDPATVRDLLGHASIVVTNRYFNVPREHLFEAVKDTFEPRAQNVPKRVPKLGQTWSNNV